MSYDLITLILSSTGVLQTVFLSVYIFSSRKISLSERLLLGFLLVAITSRLIKSIGWFFFSYEAILFLNIGFAGHSFIGPILFLYFAKKTQLSLQVWQKVALLLPSMLLLGSSSFLTLNSFWYNGGYIALLYFTLFYLIGSGVLLWKIYRKKKIYFPWYRNLYFAVTIFCLSYFTNFMLGINSYISGPVIYSVIIYGISFVLFTNHEIFTPLGDKKKYKNINLSPDQIEHHQHKIKRVMEGQRPYLDSDFSLGKLSELTSIPKHLLSRFFSENMNQSFTDYTNSYRIQNAKSLLIDDQFQHHKIAHIAYESGFNSLSSFNSAFKKHVANSPSEYRKQMLLERS